MAETEIQLNPNADSGELTPGRSLWADALRRLTRDKVAMIFFAIVMVYVLIALVPLVASWCGFNLVDWWDAARNGDFRDHGPTLQNGIEGILGYDVFGRSVLGKTILGANTSMSVGFMANIIAVPLGMLLGAIAGYYGGKVDDFIVWVYTTFACVPGIILLIAIKFAFKGVTILGVDFGGMPGLYLALAVTSWIGTCRLVRAETMRLRELDYVQAARCCGRGRFMILLKHIAPNVMHIGIINFSLGFVGAIQSEVMLSFLDIGVPAGTPSWGNMISAADKDLIAGHWWQLASAVGAMFLVVLAWNIFGDRLRDALDPKLKNAG
ncbi:MAG: ABC transporter permease [Phycisphaerales bacterium]|jgi:ABC-type dipeptide/oligopeptide/nickel transport system permease subunit|nr:ABC transporter permease [Phycisphaerales bacterium]